MERWDHVDYLPVGWNESEDVTDEVEEDATNLDLIINVYLDQYRPHNFILDVFSFDNMIPPMDNYKDQLEHEKQEELNDMFPRRIP
jgi:hypothetical protein